MKAQLIDGKRISAEIKAEAAEEAAALKAKGITPCLAVVLVGDDSASQVYVNNKKKACEAVGIRSVSHVLSGGTTEEALLELIAKLNADRTFMGFWCRCLCQSRLMNERLFLPSTRRRMWIVSIP